MAGKGGKTPGAGRKSKAQEAGLAEIIDKAISVLDWQAIFAKAADKAKKGDMNAARFAAEYRFGKPLTKVELSGNEDSPILVKAFDYSSAIAPIAPRPGEDSQPPSEDKADSDGSAVGQDPNGG